MTYPPDWTAPGSQPGNAPGHQPGGQQGPPPGHQPPGHGPPPPGAPPPGYGPPPGFGPPEPKPGIIPLRPIGLGEILDAAITYIRQNPKATLGLSAIVAGTSQVILAIMSIWLNTNLAQMRNASPQAFDSFAEVSRLLGPSAGTVIVTGFITLLASLLLTGMLTSVVGGAVLGQHTTMGAAWRQTLPRFPALLGFAALQLLVIYPLGFALAAAVLVGPGILVAIFVNPVVGAVLIFFGTLGVMAVMAWIYVTLALAVPAIMLERAGVIDALRRSYALVRGSWWRTFGILLLAWIIAIIIQYALQIPFGIAQFGLTLTGSVTIGRIIAIVGTVLAVIVISPFRSGVPALLYVDMRMRREGFDMQLQNAAGTPPPPGPLGPTPPGAPPPPPQGQPPPQGFRTNPPPPHGPQPPPPGH